ncbi:NAD(P)-binding protein [Mycena venus]|uniref:NAD(P)-binding protein n=1 Tax=Mycena venus TaxID=2733690 RepID=A0A8H7CEQ4_9AGAR|nr:NAD(P)-binding protein [Mycena venus]
MSPITNARVLFNSVPDGALFLPSHTVHPFYAPLCSGYPVPGETTVYDTSQTIDLETAPLNGGFLLKTLVLSVDPYFRVIMRKTEGNANMTLLSQHSYSAHRCSGFGIAVVLRSENPDVGVGKHVYGFTIAHQEYSVVPALGALQIMEKHPNLPWSAYLGAAGMPGQTAYIGWKEFVNPKAGEVVFVTTGAGAVGSMVIQLAKQAGLKVIASAGSEEKVKFMQSIGADVAFNYKTTDTRAVLAKEGPIDIYWDNVGGEILDAALEFSAVHARFLQCGAISEYNSGLQAPKNFHLIGERALHIHGVIMAHLPLAKYLPEFYATIPAKLASGELKYAEERTYGLEKMGGCDIGGAEGDEQGEGGGSGGRGIVLRYPLNSMR